MTNLELDSLMAQNNIKRIGWRSFSEMIGTLKRLNKLCKKGGVKCDYIVRLPLK